MYFVYFLRSESDPAKTYIGFSGNLVARLREHNFGTKRKYAHTWKHRPWKVEAVVLVDERPTARKIEKYFKSPSGKEKFQNFSKDNPENPNPIEGFFASQEAGRLFGKATTGFVVKAKTVLLTNSTP